MKQVAMGEARKRLTDLVGEVAYGGERIAIARRNRPLAVLVPLEDLAILEMIEDRVDIEAARKALADGGDSIPWEEAKRQIGL
jgi:prevent-host-death family protein